MAKRAEERKALDEMRSTARWPPDSTQATQDKEMALNPAVAPARVHEHVFVAQAVDDRAAIHGHLVGARPLAQDLEAAYLRQNFDRALHHILQAVQCPSRV